MSPSQFLPHPPAPPDSFRPPPGPSLRADGRGRFRDSDGGRHTRTWSECSTFGECYKSTHTVNFVKSYFYGSQRNRQFRKIPYYSRTLAHFRICRGVLLAKRKSAMLDILFAKQMLILDIL